MPLSVRITVCLLPHVTNCGVNAQLLPLPIKKYIYIILQVHSDNQPGSSSAMGDDNVPGPSSAITGPKRAGPPTSKRPHPDGEATPTTTSKKYRDLPEKTAFKGQLVIKVTLERHNGDDFDAFIVTNQERFFPGDQVYSGYCGFTSSMSIVWVSLF